jgi:transporter family-2 protein
MFQILAPFIAVVLVGVGIALETPTNALLARTTGSVLLASTVSFIVGGLALGAVILIRRPPLSATWADAPWYAWIGGLYGAFLVLASAWATPKLGAGTTLVVIVASQVALGVALDHFGLLGLERHPASLMRIAGIAVVCGGAVLIGKG